MPAALAAALVVLTSAAVLVLEVVVNRLVAPYVGLTLETYTAAIGVALGAIAAGAAVGGRLADRVDPRRWLGPVVVLGGVLLLAARPLVHAVGGEFRGTGPVGTVVLVALAAAAPVVALSTVTPGVVKLRLRTLAETGETVGRLSALGTLGALAGTFVTGFVLLSALPTSRVLLTVGVVLVLLGLGTAVALRTADGAPTRALAALVVLAALAATWLQVADGPCRYETRYYCASVVADDTRPGGRTLVLDGLRHAYVDLDDPAYLAFSYTRRIADALATRPPGPLRVLHLGGGGFSVPRHLAAVRPGSQSTVLEVDPEVVRIGTRELGLRTGPELQVVVGDARTRIAEQPDASYDVVVGDAFGSLAVPWHLATREMVSEVRRVLRPGGLYALNVIDYPPLGFVRAEARTVDEVFGEVAVMANGPLDGEALGNFVLVASDAPLPVDQLRARLGDRGDGETVSTAAEAAAWAGDSPLLTDDFAPVDQLLTPPYAVSTG